MPNLYSIVCSVGLCWCCVAMGSSERDLNDSEIDELVNLCPPTQQVLGGIERNCEHALEDYFSDKPVWKFVEFIYDVSKYGKLPIGSHVYGPTRLRIKELTRPLLPQLPIWQHIFEEEIDDLDIIASQVFKDETCRELLTGPIRPELSERCRAEELFQYATQLDMCLTGFEQYDWLIQKRTSAAGITLYESELESYSNIPNDEPRMRVAELKEGTLNSIWLAQRCVHLTVSAYDVDLYDSTRTFEPLEYARLASELKDSHDAAMRISARTGYPWSLFSVEPPKVVDDVEFWKSLFHVEPYLVHYWLAIGTSDLTQQQRLLHGVKAYTLKFDETSIDSFEPFIAEFTIGNEERKNRFSFPIVKIIVTANPDVDLNHAQRALATLAEDSPLTSITPDLMRSIPGETDARPPFTSSFSTELLDSQLEYPW